MSQIELSEIYRNLRLSTLDENKKPMGVNKLAEKLSIASSRISELENGKREMSLTELKVYHSFFNVSFEYLLGETEIQTANTNLVAVCKYTGLSEEAIRNICNLIKKQKDIASEIIESEEFKNIIIYFCDADMNYNFIYPSVETVAKGVIAGAGLKTANGSFDKIPAEFAKALSLVGAMGLEPVYKQKLCEEITELFEKHLKEGK